MNGLATTNGDEQASFIASQVADLTNDTTLLNKFLEEVSNPKIILEQSPNDNLTLVQIIVKAGIHLLRERTFHSPEHESLFASSLRAISNIINETPEILALPIQSGALDGQDDLWSWLLSQLLYVFLRDVTNETSDSILHTIHAVLSALQCRLYLRVHLSRCLLKIWETIEADKASLSLALNRTTETTGRDLLQRCKLRRLFTVYLGQQDHLESLSLPTGYMNKICAQVRQSLTLAMFNQTLLADQVSYMTTNLDTVTALSGAVSQDNWLVLVSDCLNRVNLISPDRFTTSNIEESLKNLINAILLSSTGSYRQWTVTNGRVRTQLLQQIVSALELSKTTFSIESCYDPQQITSKEDDTSITEIIRASAEISSFFKKRKVESTSTHSLLEFIVANTKSKAASKDLSALLQEALTGIDELPIEAQLALIRSLGQAACAANGTLAESSTVTTHSQFFCSSCDRQASLTLLPVLDLQRVDLLQICMEYLKSDIFRSNVVLRGALMISIKKIIIHSKNAGELDLSQSCAIKYINASLADDSRHVRMMTGYVELIDIAFNN